jgi:hypothetical protein
MRVWTVWLGLAIIGAGLTASAGAEPLFRRGRPALFSATPERATASPVPRGAPKSKSTGARSAPVLDSSNDSSRWKAPR